MQGSLDRAFAWETANDRRGAGADEPLRGDEKQVAFREIFEAYHFKVWSYFCRRGCTSDESSDLTQETFLRVYRNMDGLLAAQRRGSWIFTVAANLFKNEIRARRTEKRSAEEVSLEEALEQGQPVFGSRRQLEDPDDPLGSALTRERERLLMDAVDALPKRMRRAVRLRLDQDLKYREIAVIMHTSVETVKAQLFQARKRLQERLGEHFGDVDV